MAKAPSAGRTKTRLSPVLTPDQAKDLGCCFLSAQKIRALRYIPVGAAYAAGRTRVHVIEFLITGPFIALSRPSKWTSRVRRISRRRSREEPVHLTDGPMGSSRSASRRDLRVRAQVSRAPCSHTRRSVVDREGRALASRPEDVYVEVLVGKGRRSRTKDESRNKGHFKLVGHDVSPRARFLLRQAALNGMSSGVGCFFFTCESQRRAYFQAFRELFVIGAMNPWNDSIIAHSTLRCAGRFGGDMVASRRWSLPPSFDSGTLSKRIDSVHGHWLAARRRGGPRLRLPLARSGPWATDRA
jgi:hypothetical protein